MLQRFLLRTSVLYNKNTKITISFEVDMNKEWLDNIICTKKQKSEIARLAYDFFEENVSYE